MPAVATCPPIAWLLRTLGNSRGWAYVVSWDSNSPGETGMTKSVRIAVAVALVLGGTSLATAKSRGAAGTHRHPSHPAINETTAPRAREAVLPSTPETLRATAANPYYRLSDRYYDYPDPYRSLFNFYAMPPYIPGYTYRHMRMPPR